MLNFESDGVLEKEFLDINGCESLSLGENLSLFFKELNAKVDRGLATISRPIHTVDAKALSRVLERNQPSYTKNVLTSLPTPEGFIPGLGKMMKHVEMVTNAVFLTSALETESGRLYDWLKSIAAKGSAPSNFRWGISDVDEVVEKSIMFIKSLPESRNANNFDLQQLYVNFPEFVEVVNRFNTGVKLHKARSAEITSKEVGRVTEMGLLIVDKVKANDLLLTKAQLEDIEEVVNKFIKLTNVTGAMLVLMNETATILNQQAEIIKKLT